MDTNKCSDSITKLFLILKRILARQGKIDYFSEFDKINYLLFHKFCLEAESYDDIYELPLARIKITTTNHSIISIMTKYATSEESQEIRKIITAIYSYVLLEKQSRDINNAIIRTGAETFKYQERFRTIFSLMQTTAFWSLFKSPNTAAEVIDLVLSENFIDEFFSVVLNNKEEYGQSEVTSFIKNIIKRFIRPEAVSQFLNAVSLLTFPAIIKTRHLAIYTYIKDYVRDIFQKSEYLNKVSEIIKQNQKDKTISYKPITVVEEETVTEIFELNFSQIFSIYNTHTVKLPIVMQKLSLYFIIILNSLRKLLLNKDRLTLFNWGIVDAPDSKNIIIPNIKDIQDFGKRCNINITDELAHKFQNCWEYHWTTIINKKQYSIENVDPDVLAIILYATLSKSFWVMIIKLIISDEKTIQFCSEYIESFLQSVVEMENDDIKENDLDVVLEKVSNSFIYNIDQISKLSFVIRPYIKKISPSVEKAIEKIQNLENLIPKKHIKKVILSYKTNYVKGAK